MEGALGQGKKLRVRQKSAEPQVPAVPASWTAGDLKKRSSGDTQVVPAMDMPLASCTGGDLTQPPSGDAQVVEAMGMQLGALAQATELLADAAFASSATPAAISDSDLLANAQGLMHAHLEEVHRDVLAVHAQCTDQPSRRPRKRRLRRPSPGDGLRTGKRGSGALKKAQKAAMAAVVQAQAATGEGEPHYMRRRDRPRKRGSGIFKKAQKAAFSEVGHALTLIP